jgi:hypothetical protein
MRLAKDVHLGVPLSKEFLEIRQKKKTAHTLLQLTHGNGTNPANHNFFLNVLNWKKI